MADSAAEVRALAARSADLAELSARQSVCRACPRLVGWREEVAATRRKSFRDERYWGRPIPGWGDPAASILIVGLAPAAHGGNRTGRIFTGDRSGDFLFAALYRCGLAAQPTSTSADDGQRLIGARMAAAVRCAPPENKPTPEERDRCAPWLAAELRLVAPTLRVVVVLGGFAWQACWPVLAQAGYPVPRPRPAFGHGTEVVLASDAGKVLILGCFHPSQQNTFTGRVTGDMVDAVLTRARTWAAAGPGPVLGAPSNLAVNPAGRSRPELAGHKLHRSQTSYSLLPQWFMRWEGSAPGTEPSITHADSGFAH